MRRYLLLIFYIFTYLTIYSSSISGLSFSSHTVTKEKRTSLLLKEGKSFKLKKGFTLDFDIRFIEQEHNYGYIFRIIADDATCFDLVSNFKIFNKLNLSFIEGNQLYLPFDSLKYKPGEWAHIKFSIDPGTQVISISFNDTEMKTHYTNNNLSSFRFQFGYCDHPDFTSYDVPPMDIKNIRIHNETNELVANWPLRGHDGNRVYDSINAIPAIAYNPTWEIDRYVTWKKETSFKAPIYTQVAYNQTKNHIYFANGEYLLEYNPATNHIDSLKIKSGSPYHISSNQLIYNDLLDELWSYDFENPHVSVFNFKTQSWSNTRYPELRNPTHTHHNSFISPADSLLYVFGGYGEYKYRNEFKKHPVLSDEWVSIKNLPITPRYLSSLGHKGNDTILIFGGYGHESGLQELGPHNYYDLYAIDLQTNSVSKLWELKEKELFLPSNHMVVDDKLNKFFTLCFPSNKTESYIVLRSFDLDKGDFETLADTIPFIFEDIRSYCSLFYSPEDQKLYAVTIYNNHNQSDINIYSLAYPPLKYEDSLQYPVQESKGNIFLIIFSLLVIIIIIIGVTYLAKKRKDKQNSSLIKESLINNKIADDNIQTDSHSINGMSELDIPHQSSILFLGGFQVWDKNGEDITKQFTPIVKNLFILIILYSQKNKKGILSSTLREILWSDKSEESAQNNVRVNIRKLKVLFDKIDGIELINTNTYWSVNIEKPFYCDYIEILDTCHSILKGKNLSKEELYGFLQLLTQGQPLPYVQHEWVDTFKGEYSNIVQDALWKISKTEDLKTDYNLLTILADTIFLFDATDENAMCLKCAALYSSGRLGLAKSTYDNFCMEYERLLGIKYAKAFNEICVS